MKPGTQAAQMKSPAASSHGPKGPAQGFITFALVAVIVGGLALLFWPAKSPAPSLPAPMTTETTNATPGNAGASALDVGPLLGTWLREDGGYQLKLAQAAGAGKLEAAYFNPSPIRVSFVSATNDGGTLKVRVELTDTGYPGCVYSLVHDRANDRLIGTYFQAALGETYEIMFTRMP